ncbi:hypothetical protein L596_025144 [Steinernema carpocapsae]|uniref:Uncharacterized protein n=1 Tax=Steinernema carpocapsae TaxID=34508 RepID=A0A4U5M6Y2_STECR|nr:hypothetical protein L596_025144 [Steinernema carpocapsae]
MVGRTRNPSMCTMRLIDQAAIAAEESPAASTSSLKSYSTTCSFAGNSSISVITGHEAAVVLDEKYVAGHIFDLSNGEAYDTTPDENGQLIGVLRGKKMCVQPCSGGNRTAVNRRHVRMHGRRL